jgi:GWxTD domain-containing protein
MLQAERAQWERLRTSAFARTQEAPEDPDGWLALGLAAHRRGDDDAATRAFGRGLALLDAAERARLTSLTRVLPPHPAAGQIDSATFANANPAQREKLDRGYWVLADPIALTAVNEHQLEFYARVVQAELLFTVEEEGIRGADTERGDVLVRFGPPSLVLRTGGVSVDQITEWRYAYKRFYFRTPGGFGTGKLVSESYTVARDFRQATPVVWRDAPAARPEPVPLQVARFRAGGDSTAVYVSASVPVRRLVTDVGRGSASVDLGFTLFDANVETVLRDSSRLRVAVEDDVPDVRAWRGTVARGEYGVRVDALGVASRRGASGRGSVSAKADSGFGVSDLLLAASVTPIGAAPQARWTDFTTVPNAAEYRRGAPLALLWETYALAAGADSASHYRVTVSVERASRGAVLDFAGRVLAGAANAVGLGARTGGDGRLTIAFDRQAPARAAVADYLTLDLSSAPAGRYVVRVSVSDAATGRTAATFAPFRVVE